MDDHESASTGMPPGEELPTSDPAPASGPAPAAAAAVGARWATLGTDERLVLAGGVTVLVAYVLGLVLEQWGLGLASLLSIAGAIIAIVILLAGPATLFRVSRKALLRTNAALVGAFAATDLGDLVSGLGSWTTLDIVFTALIVVGAAVLVYGAWRLTGGNIVGDLVGVLGARAGGTPDRLVAIGAAAVIASWVLLSAFGYTLRTEIALAILVAVLALTVLWFGAGGAGEADLFIAPPLLQASYGIAAGALALIWFLGLLGEFSEVSAIDWIGLIPFLAGAAAMAAGGILGLQAQATRSGGGGSGGGGA